jgi:pilus assembly protein Flp/PilA
MDAPVTFLRTVVRPVAAWLADPLRRIDRDESGQGMAEYALILALIIIIAVVVLIFFGGQVKTILSSTAPTVQAS